MPHRSRALALWVGLFTLAVETADAFTDSNFYSVSSTELLGRPGSIIRAEQLGEAFGSSAYRLLYRSRGLSGEPIAVSGVAFVPAAPRRAGDVIAWAHPTTGVVSHCAPSWRWNVARSIPGLREMLEAGFIVAATDYPGLGTAGPHPYLVGVSEGRAVLDSVRAARLLPRASGGRRFAVWGHSQGGHAALYAGRLARAYAPELTLVGIAAAAPATELAVLLDDDINSVNGRILTAMTLWSWERVYGAPMRRVVKPAAVPAVNRIAQDCVESIADILALRFDERPLQGGFLTVKNLAQVQPWRSLLQRNTPGPTPRNVPVFLAQGTADTVVLPPVTHNYLAKLCRNGSRVRFLAMPRVIHAFAAYRSAGEAVSWMADRFDLAPVPDDCRARLNGR
jgi:acetyl esterase/lipase